MCYPGKSIMNETCWNRKKKKTNKQTYTLLLYDYTPPLFMECHLRFIILSVWTHLQIFQKVQNMVFNSSQTGVRWQWTCSVAFISPLLSMNRLNEADSATLSILPCFMQSFGVSYFPMIMIVVTSHQSYCSSLVLS